MPGTGPGLGLCSPPNTPSLAGLHQPCGRGEQVSVALAPTTDEETEAQRPQQKVGSAAIGPPPPTQITAARVADLGPPCAPPVHASTPRSLPHAACQGRPAVQLKSLSDRSSTGVALRAGPRKTKERKKEKQRFSHPLWFVRTPFLGSLAKYIDLHSSMPGAALTSKPGKKRGKTRRNSPLPPTVGSLSQCPSYCLLFTVLKWLPFVL